MGRNVEISKMQTLSAFRKIALGTWETTYDPTIYGTMRIRMDKALEYIEKFREKTGRRVTVTHLVVKALAQVLKECPEANAVLRWNKIYMRENVDVSVLVLMEDNGKMDLSSTMLRNADQMSLVEMVDEIKVNVDRIRAKQDKALEQTRQSMKLIPAFFINTFFKILSFFMYALNLDLSFLGLPRDAFGGAVVTSIGSLGLDIGYVPLVPYSRVPIFIAPGKVTDEAIVEDGKIVVGKILNLNASLDHRVVDGGHAATMSRVVRRIFDDPFAFFDPLD
jgi:pyruvate dehydrogenase E2 component (dihydrolipoamide acetyltransferase)